jgi:hypothetical protein
MPQAVSHIQCQFGFGAMASLPGLPCGHGRVNHQGKCFLRLKLVTQSKLITSLLFQPHVIAMRLDHVLVFVNAD